MCVLQALALRVGLRRSPDVPRNAHGTQRLELCFSIAYLVRALLQPFVVPERPQF